MTSKFKSKLEMVEFVEKKLLEQGERSMSLGDTYCAYRGADGRKCAAGHLIDDEHYHPSLEKKMVEIDAGVNAALTQSGIPVGWLDLVSKMQSVHDHASPTSWNTSFSIIKANICE
jgi:hypothetical protein